MQQARSSEQKVADKKKIIKSAVDPRLGSLRPEVTPGMGGGGATPADRRSGSNPSELVLLLPRLGLFLRTQ
jgi:hypothetical protein